MRNKFSSIEASRQSIQNKLSHLEAKIKRRQNQPSHQNLPLQDLTSNPRQNQIYGGMTTANLIHQNLNKSINDRLSDIKNRTLSSNAHTNIAKTNQESPLKKSKQLKNSMLNVNNKAKQNETITNQKIKRQNVRQSSATNPRNQSFNNNMNQNELYDMIKTIMMGQQQIQKQLSQIKQDLSVEPSVRKSLVGQMQNYSQNQRLSDTLNLRKMQQNNYQQHQNLENDLAYLNNKQQLQDIGGEAQEQNNCKQKNQSNLNNSNIRSQKQRKNNNNKNRQNFEKLVYEARHRKSQRFKVSAQSDILTFLWNDIQKKIKASNLQYKETWHLNNKHINDHLMNTIQLQRKTKEALVSKVYSQCNNCIYK